MTAKAVLRSPLLWIILVSLAIRLACIPHTNFSTDEAETYATGLNFYLSGVPATVGQRVNNSEFRIPGALQSLASGLPLFLSHGLPWGGIALLAIMNLLASLVIFISSRKLFPNIPVVYLALILFFAPWFILYIPDWNPSFLPLFSALFFYGLLRLFSNPRDFWGAFLICSTPLIMFQFHPSVVVLGPLMVTLVVSRAWPLKEVLKINLKSVLLGTLFGSLGLLPYLYQSISRPIASSGAFLSSQLHINWRNAADFFRIFLRFTSYATGETSHFIGRGLPRTLGTLNAHPWIWVPFIIGFPISVGAVFYALKFFFSSKRWKEVLSSNVDETNEAALLRHRFDAVVLFLPFITYGAFFVSLRPPTEHAYWILGPVSFYPLLRLASEKDLFQKFYRPLRYAIPAYVVTTVTYSFFGVMYNANYTHLDEMMAIARSPVAIDQGVPRGHPDFAVAQIRRALTKH